VPLAQTFDEREVSNGKVRNQRWTKYLVDIGLNRKKLWTQNYRIDCAYADMGIFVCIDTDKL
jgi:hypothetical protein